MPSKPEKKTSSIPYWDNLTNLLGTASGREMIKLLRQQGILGDTTKTTDFTLIPKRAFPSPIGPWAPITVKGTIEFQRNDPWDKYLWLEERDVLKPTKDQNTFRICLVGESVAAGMFFAPQATPAKVLNHQLNRMMSSTSKTIEVIDLSRNAMRAELLIQTVDAATQLDPDWIIVFAGNNFCRNHTIGRPDLPFPTSEQVKAIQKNGINGLFSHFNEQLESVTEQIIKSLTTSTIERSIDLLWIIPTTSKSWPRWAPPPRIGNIKLKTWYDHFDQVVNDLEEKNYSKLLERAKGMLALDQGLCPTTYRLLAIAHEGLGEMEVARFYSEKEVDVDCVLQRNSFLAPGIQSNVRNLIRISAVQQGFSFVDLEEVFKEEHNKYFVDYCHLTVEGMHKVAQVVSGKLLSKIDLGESQKLHSWEKYQSNIDKTKLARGHFEAAIYNCHLRTQFYTSYKTMMPLFLKALDISGDIGNDMMNYVKMRSGRCVHQVSPHTHDLVSRANSLLDFGIIQWIKGIDAHTIEAICTALQLRGYPGNALLKEYQSSDLQELKKGLDLSNPRYLTDYAKDGVVDWDDERGTYRTQPFIRSFWPKLSFTFVAQKAMKLRLTLSTRLPEQNGTETVKVLVNNQFISNITAHQKWSKHHLEIPPTTLKDGLNSLILEWPQISEEETVAPEEVVRSFQLDGKLRWYPVFGEVFTCRLNLYDT